MHISTNDLHCCKPARLLQLAPSGGRPRRRPPAAAPHASPHLTNNDGLRWKTDGRPPANGPPTATPQQRRHSPSTPARGPPRPPTARPSPQPPPPPSQSQGQVPITEQNFSRSSPGASSTSLPRSSKSTAAAAASNSRMTRSSSESSWSWKPAPLRRTSATVGEESASQSAQSSCRSSRLRHS